MHVEVLTPDATQPDDPGAAAPPRRHRRALVTILAAVAGLAVAVAATPAPDPAVTAVGERMGVAAGELDAVPPPTVAPTTTTTIATLPVPEALPPYAYAETPQIVLGSLEIPKLGVVGELQEGMTLTAINRGPSHWPGTAMPGRPGNVVVAGHRTTYSRPFHDLDLLVAGDRVLFHMKDGTTYTYEVRGVVIVPAEAIGIAAQDWAHTATLFACHPKGSATHRVVAKLRLLDEDGKPVDDEASLPPMDVGLRPEDYQLTVRDAAGPAPLQDPFAATDG